MKRYCVKCLLKYAIEDYDSIIYEESIMLFHSENKGNAYMTAMEFCWDCEQEYFNVYARKVNYSFHQIADCYEITDKIEFQDGFEVFRSYFKLKNPDTDIRHERYYHGIEDMGLILSAETNGFWVKDE